MTRRNDMKSIIIEMADKLYREDTSRKIKPSKKSEQKIIVRIAIHKHLKQQNTYREIL